VADGVTIKVEGWRELSADFRKMGPEAKKDLREAMKPAGILVRDRARQIARAEGLLKSGTLIRRVTVAVNAKGVEVRAAATNRNDATRFNYPRRYEFTGRPFLAPALEQQEQHVAEIVFGAFDDLAVKYGF
jgi:hypothetical protein